MKRFFIVVCPLLTAGLLSACDPVPIQTAKPPTPPVSVQVTHAIHGSITRSITLPAVIRPNQQVMLYAKVAGYLKFIKVDRGDAVKEGDVLAEVEAPELLADEAKYQADVEVAKADYQRLSEARKAAADLVVPLTVDAAKGKYEMALANLKRNETLLAYTKIVAQFSGTVTKRWVDPGALIPAATAGTAPQSAAVVTLMDFSIVRIEVAVPEPETPLIKDGLAAEIKVDELVGKIYSGKVTRFAHTLDDATRTMAVEIDLDNAEGMLRPGMFATAKLAVARKDNALLLPSEALVVEKANTSVFLFAADRAKKVPVKTGFDDSKSVEILEGITAEDAVILTGKLPLTDGQSVKQKEAK